MRLPCSLLELKYLNIFTSLKTFLLGSAISRSTEEWWVWCRWACGRCASAGALSLPFDSSKKVKTGQEQIHVKGLYLGEKWQPGARQHAGPVERPVPGPFSHHLRIISIHGEFRFTYYLLQGFRVLFCIKCFMLLWLHPNIKLKSGSWGPAPVRAALCKYAVLPNFI